MSPRSRHRQVRLASVDRLARAGADAEVAGGVGGAPALSSSGLRDTQSVVVTPLLLHDRLLGVLYLDSPHAGRFDADDARLIDVLAGHLALTVGLHESGGS